VVTPDEAVRYWTLIGGIVTLIGGVMHAVYRLGRILEKFAQHVADSKEIHKDYEGRLRVVEGRRR
jgi:hypothetical protein